LNVLLDALGDLRRYASGDAGILEDGLARRLAGWAGLRNVVAHSYPVIDFDRIHKALREDIGDLDSFSREVEKMIASVHTE